jgi:benzylsuccinate CoA-transferase BbsF subunit
MDRWGLGYEALRAANPRIIMLSSSLNGQTGPDRGLAGFGTMGAHLAGFGELTGWPDRPPAGPFTAYTDYTAPKAITAALLAALDHRDRTGEGQHIDLSQIEVALHYITPALLAYQATGELPARGGNRDAEHAPHGVYPCAGRDRWIALACGEDAEWQALCTLADSPEWGGDPRFATAPKRRQNAAALDELIAEWTRPQAAEALEAALQAAGIAAHRCSTSADLVADPQLAHRGHWATVPHPELGEVVVESNRVRLSATPHRTVSAGPMFGEHNEYVLRELIRLTDEEISELVVAGALS